jgi:hypothetical protein
MPGGLKFAPRASQRGRIAGQGREEKQRQALRTLPMTRSLIFFQLTLAASLGAQQGHPQPADQDRIGGKIVSSKPADKDAITITINSGKGKIPHEVFVKVSNIKHSNKPATLADVKEGRTLNCIGGEHNEQFVAQTCKVN